MRDGLGQVSVVTLFAVVAVASSCVVAAVETNASALPSRQFVQLHVEATSPGVKVAVTGCGGGRENRFHTHFKAIYFSFGIVEG